MKQYDMETIGLTICAIVIIAVVLYFAVFLRWFPVEALFGTMVVYGIAIFCVIFFAVGLFFWYDSKEETFILLKKVCDHNTGHKLKQMP